MNNSAEPYVVALCQMNSGDEVTANITAVQKQLAAAANAGARLACLPEMFTCMSADPAAKQRAAEEPGSGQAQDFLATSAAQHNMYIAGGSIPIRDKTKIRNRTYLYAPDGKPVAHYDKIHLFRYAGPERSYDEHAEYEAGNTVVLVPTDLGRIGLTICFDVRFPELYRQLDQPDLVLVPAAFTRPTGRAHWQTLLCARAIENQCYVLAPAQCGIHPGGISTWGHSMVVDPWGVIVATVQGDDPDVLLARIDPGRITSCRDCLPAESCRML